MEPNFEFKKASTQKTYVKFLNTQIRRDTQIRRASIPEIRSSFENELPDWGLKAVFLMINMDHVENEH